MAEFPALPRGSPRGTGFIYFLVARENLARPMLKIGFSLRDPDKRLSDCQTGSPTKLELVAIIAGTMTEERDLHRRFAELRSHCEWFFYEGELLSYVQELGA